MLKMTRMRWAFNVSSWSPTQSEILTATSWIQPEEKMRIAAFVFQRDAKSSLIGRLMMRKFASEVTGTADVRFDRDERGKPILANHTDLSFNVSHQGDFAVLAGEVGALKVGVDVMKTEPFPNKNVAEMFRLMRRQFSPLEWQTMNNCSTEKEKLVSFYRFWCLKESYVKNIGVGLNVDLSRISFSVTNDALLISDPKTNTKLAVDGKSKDDWIFEETLLNDCHVVAVAIDFSEERSGIALHKPERFIELNFGNLMTGVGPFEPDPDFTKNFFKKEQKPF